MTMEKRRNCKSGIYLAAIDNIPPDVFDPPLDDEQMVLYHSIQKMIKDLKAKGITDYVIDIPSDE